MNAIVFGATGMVGQGVLRECLLDPSVTRVLTVGRTVTGQTDAKLREIAHADLFDLTAIEPQLTGYDACFFCLGGRRDERGRLPPRDARPHDTLGRAMIALATKADGKRVVENREINEIARPV
jgi:uncharacterized protein YbjT (DUF2867 family)